jgi:rhodanese-related sulfurtransferase
MPTRDVTAAEAAEALAGDPRAVYLDVRTEAEFEAGHPRGALNAPVVRADPATGRPVPNPEFTAVVARVVPRDAPLFVGCQSGMRSLRACALLAEAGFTSLHNVRDGFGGARDAAGRLVEPGWQGAGLPVEGGAPPGASWSDLRTRTA